MGRKLSWCNFINSQHVRKDLKRLKCIEILRIEWRFGQNFDVCLRLQLHGKITWKFLYDQQLDFWISLVFVDLSISAIPTSCYESWDLGRLLPSPHAHLCYCIPIIHTKMILKWWVQCKPLSNSFNDNFTLVTCK
jgi:hypothetical protein